MKKVEMLSVIMGLFYFTVFLFTCKEKDNCETFTHIGRGNSGVGSKQDKIISSQEEWDKLLMALDKYETDHFSETEIDFNKYLIIAVFDDVRPSTGWGIDITCIAEYSDRIIVTVIETDPKGRPALDILTKPYHIVKIPVTNKNIEFNHIKK